MSLGNIKSNTQAQKGFTIVELLIVVVVIAILAAITIVSYNGITSRANASSAQSTAATVQKKIELYSSEEGRYPITETELTSTTSKSYSLDAAMLGSAVPTPSTAATKGTGYVQVQTCSTGVLSATTVTGARVTWWDYQKTASQATPVDVGVCASGTTLTGLPA